MRHFFCLSLLSCLLSSSVMLRAQAPDNYTPISLNDLSGFESAASAWKVQGEIAMNPLNPTGMSTKAGSGILVGSKGQPIRTRTTMQDMRLRLECMLSPGAQAYIILPGGPRILLAEGTSASEPTASTSGYVGQFPIQNAAKAAGLWQVVELAYDAQLPTQPTMSRLNSLVLNGVVVQQNVYLPRRPGLSGAQPIALEVTNGTAAFRNIGFQSLANRQPLKISDLSYRLYTDAWDTATPVKLDREEKTTAITQEVANGLREFHLFFEGTMNIEESGDYTFTIAQSGPRAQLSIDGKPVVTVGESTSQDLHTGRAVLEKGTHRFILRYSRFPWRRPALGLSVTASGIRSYDLSALSSLPVPEPKPYLGVTPEDRPEMIRSFVFYGQEKAKRTHVLSVGSPAGWHYTLDLNRGALLQTWRGQFADVTEMWYERGEPQLLSTAGLTVPVSGQSSYAVLSDKSTAWPDSAAINYLGYRLTPAGVPAMRYALGAATLTDLLSADTKGLNRTVSLEGNAPANLFVLAGVGSSIVQVEKGLYRIDDRYYVRVDKKLSVTQRTSAGRQELLIPVNGKVEYSMFW
ncbi:family 16 glycoside hydrolase [Arundinibacter roseus]|uniref:DUF1080 domain-containing protein n=1 Tax=Arundinibacter roseus TaxID=2070510 RepID=A0A4R4KGM4_9BACT|nr:family 16 glycoside hydrolase [Arundinibacter roseus]TDB66046.1 DUF1080 domain-containing protein [Arundinibacter roseus]